MTPIFTQEKEIYQGKGTVKIMGDEFDQREMKQWNHAYTFCKISLIIILGFLNLILNVEKSDTIMALTGIILIVCCAHEMLVDLNLIERDRSEWGINVAFVLLEIVIGMIACLLLENWYNALIIYIIMRPYNKWLKRIRILLPPVGYLIQLQYAASIHEPVITKFRDFFLLFIICLGLYYLEKFLRMYEKKENLILEAVKQSVLNELYAKNMSKELAEQVLVVEENARYEERENIARSMHNAVGHTITSAIVALNATKVMYEVDPSQAKDKLTVAEQRMRMSLNEIRQAVRVLDKETKELTIQELINMLKIRCEQFMLDTEIQIIFDAEDVSEDTCISSRHCEFLHSALSEALTNGVRHGEATRFYVKITCDSRHVQLIVKDNGASFEQLSIAEQQIRLENGYGLKKIQKYIASNGGIINLEARDGFQIVMELPLIDLRKRDV